MTSESRTPLLGPEEIQLLESDVGAALRAGSDATLTVLGYGEITLVLGWPHRDPAVAAKRLPPFGDRAEAVAYGHLVEEYLDALGDHGVRTLRSEFHLTPEALGNGWAGYVVQPVLPPEQLAANILAAPATDEDARALLAEVVGSIVRCVDPWVGLDGQLSNWATTSSGLRYLDVTTPLLNDDSGRARVDLGVLTSPLPAALRPIVRRFVAPGITARYHRSRDVLVDLAGNLLKERLDHWVPAVLELANPHLDQALDEKEVRRYYRGDALTWELLLRMRKADRWWQQRVRRRPYGSLLPRDVRR
jgi:hypothetical protein